MLSTNAQPVPEQWLPSQLYPRLYSQHDCIYCMTVYPDHLGSSGLSVSPASFLRTPNLPAVRATWKAEKSLTCVSSSQQQLKHQYITNFILTLNPQHTNRAATSETINCTPAKIRTVVHRNITLVRSRQVLDSFEIWRINSLFTMTV